jgi:hypothetical protein
VGSQRRIALGDTFDDRWRVYVVNGDGARIVFAEGRTSMHLTVKLQRMMCPEPVLRWLREATLERVWQTAHGEVVEEIAWVTMAGLGLV